MTARDVAAAMNGRLVTGSPDARIDTVSIDSRTVQAGDLFFAIHGERFDGHDFVASAVGSGAAGVVVHRAESVEAAREAAAVGPSPVVIEVEDTTRALQALARDVRRQSGARVVAITGSAGKTTTKEVTAAFLALRYRTFRNKGNLNNHIGLPLSLLELRTRPEMAVVELGMSAPGEIRTLVAIAEPDVRVWTNVGEAHLESFPSVDAIADAKAEILEGADRDACLVMNADDARVVERGRTFAGRVRSFGIEKAADVQATDVEDRGLDGMRATVRISTAFGDAESLRAGSDFEDGVRGAGARASGAAGRTAGASAEGVAAEAESVTLEIPLLGRANLANVLAGMAVALDAGVPLPALVERAATLSPASHRGEVKRLASGVTVLDDAYNANPLAVRRALEVIASEPHARRRVAVLGEMLELGPESVRLHEECGRAAVRSKIDVLVTVGKESARALGEAAVAAGLARAAVTHFADSTAAADAVAALVQSGDVVLVKGSRGARLERVVERLHGAAG